MKQEKKAKQEAAFRYTQLEEGDVLLGREAAYLVVRREGKGLTYLSLLGEEGRPLVVVRSVQDLPLDPVWELVKRPWSF